MRNEDLLSKLGLDSRDGVFVNDGKEIKFNCPFCMKMGEPTPDKRYRFQLHIGKDEKRGLYQCFRCGKKGRVKEEDVVLGKINLKDILPAEKGKEIVLPDPFYPVTKEMDAYKYLLSRGMEEEDIAYYDLGISNGRVVFPDYIDNRLTYWVSRSYGPTSYGPKYFNCPGVKRSNQLYNLGRFLSRSQDSIVITEGPISAIVAGRDAVATYGKMVTYDQITTIQRLPIQRVYVALDPDAKKEALKVAKSLASTSLQVKLVCLPKGEDPASVGREGFQLFKSKALDFDLYNKLNWVEFIQS